MRLQWLTIDGRSFEFRFTSAHLTSCMEHMPQLHFLFLDDRA